MEESDQQSLESAMAYLGEQEQQKLADAIQVLKTALKNNTKKKPQAPVTTYTGPSQNVAQAWLKTMYKSIIDFVSKMFRNFCFVVRTL